MPSKYLLEYIALRMFVFFIQRLPEKLAVAAGKKTGSLAAFFLRKRVRLAHQNLQLAYGDKVSPAFRKKIISNLFQMLGEAAIESIIFKRKDIAANIHIRGWEHLENALKRGKGVILIAPHLGMWELASYVFGARLENASTVYKSLKNPLVDRYLIKNREKIAHLDLIPSKNGLKQVLRKLRRGKMVVMLFDQNAGRNGLPVKFFGKTAYTYSAPAVFAQKTGCAVIPGHIVKEDAHRTHTMVLDRPIPLIDTGDKEKDIWANTQQYTDYIETIVRQYPEQWFGWIHRRWRIPRKIARLQNKAPESSNNP